MSYKYFRFYLNPKKNSKIDSIENYKSLFNDDTHDGFVRASFDLESPQKSISILCQSDKGILDEKKHWKQFFTSKRVPISQKIEHEEIEDVNEKLSECIDHCCSHHEESEADDHDHHDESSHDDDKPKENHWKKAALGMAFGISLLAVELLGFTVPVMAGFAINGISALLTLYLGKNLYQAAWQQLKKKQISTATLYTISTLTILGLSVLSLVFPGLPLMLESAPLILGFWHLGEAIEHSLLAKIHEKLDVRDCVPKSVHLKGQSDKSVSVKTLIPNDIIVLNKGDVIPVDGILRQPAMMYTTRVDGSPYSKKMKAGDAVKSGMVYAGDAPKLQIRVKKTFQNSYLSLIAKNIESANKQKAPVEEFANKVLKYFVPGLISASAISGVALSLMYNYGMAIQSVIAILVSACPCALSLITPMAVKVSMKKASEEGVHFKHGKALQSAANVDAVVFDLNGTLTVGKPSIHKLKIKDFNLLKHVASLEAHSEHPISKTIIDYIARQGVNTHKPLKVTGVDKSHHAGIMGMIEGERYIIGNRDMLQANNLKAILPKNDADQHGTIYMVRGSKLIGEIMMRDQLRSDALTTVQHLTKIGKHVHICTGADKATAEYYAKKLKIPKSNICANTVGAITNEDEVSKESYIQKLQDKGLKVAMVGDAANDLTAITRSDVGVAVKSSIGDTLTEQHAGMSIHEGLLFPIATGFDIAAKAKSNIYQNLFISLSYNSLITLVGAGLFASFGFVLTPAIGVVCMVLESALVLGNLYRLKVQKPASQSVYDTEPRNAHILKAKLESSCCHEHKCEQEHAFSRTEICVSSKPLQFSKPADVCCEVSVALDVNQAANKSTATKRAC